jgi:hypothetical protein
MSSNKLIVAFRPLSEAGFQLRYNAILAGVTDNPRVPEPYPPPVPGLTQLRQEIEDYHTAHLAVQRRDLSQLHKRDDTRERLTNSLQRVAAYVELLANGDIDLLQSCGFDLRRDPGRPLSNGGAAGKYIAAPEDFRVGVGPRAGSLQVDATRQRGAIAYEIQTTCGDPAVEEGWKQALIVPTVRRVIVDKLPAGPTWARLRAVRPGGLTGPWTSPISVIVS